MKQIEQMTEADKDAMPREFAGALNLMAHPMAGFAAAGAIGLGMASHALGMWMGAVAGMAEASGRVMADTAEAPQKRAGGKPVKLKLVASTPATEATEPPRAKDDLKAISGIGPKLEKVLNGFGIVTYEQVAALTKAEIARLDEQLGFAGRIERDDWLGQASRLAGK